MARKTFVAPDGGAVVTCDSTLFSDTWRLSVGENVIQTVKNNSLAEAARCASIGRNWGVFDLNGGGYSIRVVGNAKTRQTRVFFLPDGLSWKQFEMLMVLKAAEDGTGCNRCGSFYGWNSEECASCGKY
ncbi:MAG: hypothetical protein QM783_17280 [Phycisphaerales bacterium]